jgi:hypothetical protein
MRRKFTVCLALLILFLLCTIAANAVAASAHRTLQVKLNYTGAATVDQQHQIYVLLFDANPLTATSLVDSTAAATPPSAVAGVSHILRRLAASGKNEMITFADLTCSPVYVAAFVDMNGSYDGHSDPVSGAPMGWYGKPPGKIVPIALDGGKTIEIVLAFDDSTTTP